MDIGEVRGIGVGTGIGIFAASFITLRYPKVLLHHIGFSVFLGIVGTATVLPYTILTNLISTIY